MSLRDTCRRGLASTLSRFPHSWLDKFEAIFQEAQGKGWGYGGVTLEIRALSKLMSSSGIEAPKTILDVGANVGNWTHAAQLEWPNIQIFALEPSLVAYTKLCRRMEKVESVVCCKIALSDSCGESKLFSNESGSELSSLRQRHLEHFGNSLSSTETVTISTLDQFVMDHGITSIDILKIDVEGFEMEVLNGGQDSLDHVKVVQFEWAEASTGASVHWVDFWYFFQEREMEIFRITPNGAKKIERYHPRDEVMTWTNYLAIRRP
jgi:FkbM family methyltransferase